MNAVQRVFISLIILTVFIIASPFLFILLSGGDTTSKNLLFIKVFVPLRQTSILIIFFSILAIIIKLNFRNAKLKWLTIIFVTLYLLILFAKIISYHLVWKELEMFNIYPDAVITGYHHDIGGIDSGAANINITFKTQDSPLQVFNMYNSKKFPGQTHLMSQEQATAGMPTGEYYFAVGKIRIFAGSLAVNGTTGVVLQKYMDNMFF